MSDSARVQRWREAKWERGLRAVTVWLGSDEDLRLKDLALQWHCSPSELMQRALAQFHPGQPPGIRNESISNDTDMVQLRQLIREELTAMQATHIPVTDTVTDTVTVMVTETPGEGAIVVETATLKSVTVTGNGNVSDTQGPRQPGKLVPFKDQVLLVVTAQGPLTCDAVADAVHDAKHKKTWRVLQELIAQGRLRKEGTRENTVYQVA
jgi:hypothetical protein